MEVLDGELGLTVCVSHLHNRVCLPADLRAHAPVFQCTRAAAEGWKHSVLCVCGCVFTLPVSFMCHLFTEELLLLISRCENETWDLRLASEPERGGRGGQQRATRAAREEDTGWSIIPPSAAASLIKHRLTLLAQWEVRLLAANRPRQSETSTVF